MIKKILLIAIFFFIGLGSFYSSSKFHIPWYGASDFKEYSLMVDSPYENTAKSPFSYRVLTPLVAHYIRNFKIFYDSKYTPFKDHATIFENISYPYANLESLIFTNFIFLVFSAFFLSSAITLEGIGENPFLAFFTIALPAMLFLSLSTQVHALAGLTEGGSLFLISLLLYLLKKDNFKLFSLFIIVSIFQRELISLILTIYIIFNGNYKSQKKYLFSSLISLLAYLIISNINILRIHEGGHFFDGILYSINNFRFTSDFLFQVLIANNIPIAILLIVLLLDYHKLLPVFKKYLIIYLIILGIGLLSGINNNIGRISNLLLPILLYNFACSFIVSNEKKRSQLKSL